MILVLVLAAFQVYASIVRERDDQKFYDVTLTQRAAIATVYFALVVFLLRAGGLPRAPDVSGLDRLKSMVGN